MGFTSGRRITCRRGFLSYRADANMNSDGGFGLQIEWSRGREMTNPPDQIDGFATRAYVFGSLNILLANGM